MKGKMKRLIVMILAVTMVMVSAVPAFAATSKYGEDKPLKSVNIVQLTINAGHKHTYIDANNGCRYQLYHSCMDGMVGSTPTNHSSTVTIDGVKYTLCNYSYKNQVCNYANVIKKIGGTSSATTTTNKVPLSKITLNKSTVSLNVGSSSQLSVTYSPSNTTDSKTVTWSSSNTAVATVSGGKVTAKKAGTATITAKVGTKTATCKVTVKAAAVDNGSYKNVSEAYTLLNTFRTTKSNQWYWNSSNTAKTTVYGLKGLTRDVTLENVAKTRAKEQWTMYYERGQATHTRPNGTAWSTAYPSSLKTIGENLAWRHTTCNSVILDPDYGWAETNAKYSGQGHRRNMLNSSFTKVGIACYVKDGKTCWAMCLGN